VGLPRLSRISRAITLEIAKLSCGIFVSFLVHRYEMPDPAKANESRQAAASGALPVPSSEEHASI
jgi:hypothetical protein